MVLNVIAEIELKCNYYCPHHSLEELSHLFSKHIKHLCAMLTARTENILQMNINKSCQSELELIIFWLMINRCKLLAFRIESIPEIKVQKSKKEA